MVEHLGSSSDVVRVCEQSPLVVELVVWGEGEDRKMENSKMEDSKMEDTKVEDSKMENRKMEDKKTVFTLLGHDGGHVQLEAAEH